jgi:hypothetical protein
MARNAQRRTKDLVLTIPVEEDLGPVLKVAAQRDGRSVAGYIRWVVVQDLQSKGLIDEEGLPVEETVSADDH